MSRHTETQLATVQAGVLNNGDEFKFQPGGAGTSWGVFTFLGHTVTEAGAEWVSCFGGDPNPKGTRQWRSFPVDRVREEALRAGRLGLKRSAA